MKRPIKMRLLMMLSSLLIWGQEVVIVRKPTQPMGYCHTQWHGHRRTSHPVWLGKRWRQWCFWELHTSTWHNHIYWNTTHTIKDTYKVRKTYTHQYTKKKKMKKDTSHHPNSDKVDIISKFSQTSCPASCRGSPPRPRDWEKRSRGRDQGTPDNCRKYVEESWEKWEKDQYMHTWLSSKTHEENL